MSTTSGSSENEILAYSMVPVPPFEHALGCPIGNKFSLAKVIKKELSKFVKGFKRYSPTLIGHLKYIRLVLVIIL